MLSVVLGPYAVIAMPAIGGLVFGSLIHFFAREANGHGIPEAMLAVALRGGRIHPAFAGGDLRPSEWRPPRSAARPPALRPPSAEIGPTSG